MDPKGLPRAPKRDPKMIQNSSKIHPGTPWHAQGCQGVPPRCLQATRDAYLCVFMHIFMHIYRYLCIFMHIFCIFMILDTYVYIFYIFMHICVNVMHIYAYLCIFTHIYAYPCIFTHTFSYKDVDILLMNNCAAGLHSTGS